MKLKEFFKRKKLSPKCTSSKSSGFSEKDAPMYQKKVELGDFCTLMVKVDVPRGNPLLAAKVITNEAMVDKFLEGLDSTLKLNEIYVKVMQLFEFSKDDISKKCLTVYYVKHPEKKRAENRK